MKLKAPLGGALRQAPWPTKTEDEFLSPLRTEETRAEGGELSSIPRPPLPI